MDFPADSYEPIDLPKPVLLVVSLLESLICSIAFILHRLGLIRPTPPPPQPSSMELLFHHAVDPASAVSTKKQLVVVEFARLSKRRGSEGPAAASCAICLGQVEAEHKVRELGNCAHGFHVECIDSWIDAGWLSCPLCRADLLPAPRGGRLPAVSLPAALEILMRDHL